MVLPLKRRKSRSPPGSPNPSTPGRQPAPAPRRGLNTPPTLTAAGWSSPVARQAHNLKVVGSNPTPATTLPLPGSTGGPDHSAAPLPSAVRSRLMTSAARCSPVQAYFKTARPRRNSGPSRTVCYGRARPCGMWFPQPGCSRIAKRHAPLMALSLLPGMQAARGRPALIFS